MNIEGLGASGDDNEASADDLGDENNDHSGLLKFYSYIIWNELLK